MTCMNGRMHASVGVCMTNVNVSCEKSRHKEVSSPKSCLSSLVHKMLGILLYILNFYVAPYLYCWFLKALIIFPERLFAIWYTYSLQTMNEVCSSCNERCICSYFNTDTGNVKMHSPGVHHLLSFVPKRQIFFLITSALLFGPSCCFLFVHH
jgi:hypothetical protein